MIFYHELRTIPAPNLFDIINKKLYFQNMVNNKEHFDFSRLVGELDHLLPTSSVEEAKRFRSALFTKRDFTAFAAHFFSDDMAHAKTQYFLNQYKSPTQKRSVWTLGMKAWSGIHNNYTGFARENGIKIHKNGLRKTDKHPLSKQEFSDAIEFCQDNPDYLYAIAGIQACIFEYLTELEHALQNDERTKNTYPDFRFEDGTSAELRMRSFLDNVKAPVFIQDLSTTMAVGILKNGGEFSDQTLQRSLVDQFRRQTFKSSDWGFDNGTKCPFSSFYAIAMSVKLIPHHDDETSFNAQQGVFGDLLRDLMTFAPDDLEYRQNADLVGTNIIDPVLIS